MKSKFKHYTRVLNKSRVGFMVIDAIGIALTYAVAIFALWLIKIPDFNYRMAILSLPVIIAFKLIVFYIFRLYHVVLINVSLDEVIKITWVVALTNVVIVAITLVVPDYQFINEFYFLFTTLMEIFFLILPRIINRLLDIFFARTLYKGGNRTLIVGAGAGGKIVINEIRNNPA
ncbi:MAG: hypothetical protein PHW21_03375, partial [Candidatus Izemoplasmatales bacterium]|nr:hypothetical protein [Candidatus Izemoplasmatales bacterium]